MDYGSARRGKGSRGLLKFQVQWVDCQLTPSTPFVDTLRRYAYATTYEVQRAEIELTPARTTANRTSLFSRFGFIGGSPDCVHVGCTGGKHTMPLGATPEQNSIVGPFPSPFHSVLHRVFGTPDLVELRVSSFVASIHHIPIAVERKAVARYRPLCWQNQPIATYISPSLVLQRWGIADSAAFGAPMARVSPLSIACKPSLASPDC